MCGKGASDEVTDASPDDAELASERSRNLARYAEDFACDLHQETVPFLYESFETALVECFPDIGLEMLIVLGAVISGKIFVYFFVSSFAKFIFVTHGCIKSKCISLSTVLYRMVLHYHRF